MKKKFAYPFLLLFLIILILLPTLLSTSFGKPFFVRALQHKLHATINIEKLQLSWLGPQKLENISFSNPYTTGSVETLTSNVPFWSLSRMSDTFLLENGTFSFPSYSGGKLERINAKVIGKNIQATGVTSEGGSFKVQGNIDSQEDFDLTGHFQKIPTIALDGLLQSKDLLYKVLGPTFNLNGAFTYQKHLGTLSLDFSSLNGQASLSASMADHILTLKEPLMATLRITENFSNDFDNIPKIATQDPIILRIMTQDFQLPFDPFSLKHLQIGNASLNLGKIQVQSDQSIRSLLKLFKNVTLSQHIPIWFSPVNWKINKGVLEIGRIDALVANAIHLCAWGQIDLLRDDIEMMIGIPSDTLEQFFGIQSLSKNYVLGIPVRGSLKNPELVTGPAIAKITAMSASQQLPVPGGKIFGRVVQTFTQATEGEKAPPPNRPFPWEK